MTKSDYLSQDPLLVALIAKRAELIERFRNYIPNIKVFCKEAHISTATLYLIINKKYVKETTWLKVLGIFKRLVSKEDYLAYWNEYGELDYEAFCDTPYEEDPKAKRKKTTMRTFITKTAGATFYAGNSFTFNIRKDSIEIINKLQPKGWYTVVNLLCNERGWMLCCNWGTFFRRVFNHEDPSKLLSMLKKPCPTVAEIFTNADSKYMCVHTPDHKESMIAIRLPEHLRYKQFNQLLGEDELLDMAEEIGEFNLDLYDEIRKNCPFKGWVDGLREL